jgi:hypothetical protein
VHLLVLIISEFRRMFSITAVQALNNSDACFQQQQYKHWTTQTHVFNNSSTNIEQFRRMFSTTAVQTLNNSDACFQQQQYKQWTNLFNFVYYIVYLFMTYLTRQLIVHIILRRNSRCIVTVVEIYGVFSPWFTDKPRHNTLPDALSAYFVDRVSGTFNSRWRKLDKRSHW